MADIKRLDGTTVTQEEVLRNEGVARVLERAAQRNNRGKTSCIIIIEVTSDNGTRNDWFWESATQITSVSILGSIEVLKHDLIDSMNDNLVIDDSEGPV